MENYKLYGTLGLIIFLSLMFSMPVSADAFTKQESLGQGIVSYWNFDEGTGTKVTNIYDGTIHNLTVSGTNWTATGLISGAYSPESDDSDSEINLNGKSNISIAFWMKRGGSYTGDNYILKNGNCNGAGNIAIDFVTASKIQICMNELTDTYTDYLTGFTPRLNEWEFVVLTTNTTNGYTYVNGVKNQSRAFTVPFAITNANLDNIFDGFSNDLMIDEWGIWNKTLNQTDITRLYNSGAGLTYTENNVISLNSPSSNANIVGLYPTLFNCSVADTFTVSNITLFIDGSINYTQSSSADELDRYLSFNLGSYSWTCESRDTNNILSTTATRYFNATGARENSQNYNSSTYETKKEDFFINVSSNGLQTVSANLIYNGTSYSGTKTGNNYNMIFSYSQDTPLVSAVTNKTFYWDINYGGTHYNSTVYNQTTNPIYFNICNSTLNVPYLNFTFKDESDLSIINASISSSTFDYWFGDGIIKKTLSFTNSSNNYNYTFCFSPSDKTINLDYTISYLNSVDGYPQRTSNPNNSTYTNSTTNKVLYLLNSANGIYVTFQVVNSADQPLEGVLANATKSIDGTDTIVGQGTTGADGGITFWLNPDSPHTFSFSKSGYTQYTFSTSPTQTSYTIVLGGGTTQTEFDYTRGISYSIQPTGNWIYNNTDYSFNFTISSTYWALQSYGFILRFSNGTTIGSISDTTQEGGTVNINANTLINTQIVMDFYYIINGTSINMSRTWLVYDSTGSSFSIWNFFQRFKTYMGTSNGIFGLTNQSFSLNLIIYMFILVVVGLMSYKFGLSSPAAILGILFALVAFFDVVLGLLYNPPLATSVGISNFPTILIGIILIGITIREVYT